MPRAGDDMTDPSPAVPFCPQARDYDCGTACLAMVARHYGIDTSADSLRGACQPDYGISVPGLIDVAKGLGLHTQRLPSDSPVTDLQTAIRDGRPVIVAVTPRWVYGIPLEVPHYVVIIGLDDEHAAIHDPDVGPNIRVPRSAILAGWADASFRGVIAWKQ